MFEKFHGSNDIEVDKKILEKAEALDIIRFVCSLCVVLFHYNQFTKTNHDDTCFPFFNVLGGVYVNGWRCVEFFFLLSGFTFFLVYERVLCNKEISLIEYLKRRFIRIFPLYYFSTIVAVIIYYLSNKCLGTGIFNYDTANYSVKYIIINIFGIARGWLENSSYPYNGPAWTISVEIFCYILFFIICWFCSNPLKRNFLYLFLAFIGGVVVYYNFDFPIINKEMARGVACFFWGGVCILQRIIEKRKINRIVSMTSFIILILFYYLRMSNNWYIFTYLLFPTIILFVVNSFYINSFLRRTLLRQCGKISFSIYLNQMPYMSFLFLISGLVLHINFYSKLFFLFYLGTLVFISIFTNKLIEQKGSYIFEKVWMKCISKRD